MNPNYFRISISGLAPELEEQATEICFRYGCEGVSEALAFEQADLKYLPRLMEKSELKLDAFFTNIPDKACLLELEELHSEVRLQVFDEEGKDWLEEWKKGFAPFALVESIWVVPSWCEAPPEAKSTLLIDPGMAFGTGTHETTQLAAGLIRKLFLDGTPPESVLDVGTGTGILALLARHLGARQVRGLEIDPIARVVARENLAINKMTDIEVPEHQIEDEDQSYDLVIANIVDGVLVELKTDLLRCTRPGKNLILSGILSERYEAFLPQFLRDTDCQVCQRVSKGEWEGLWLKRN